MSWPQACITPTSVPLSSFVRTVLAYARPVISSTGSASSSVRSMTDRAGAVLQHAQHAGAADAGGHFVAELAQARGELRRRLLLVRRQLGLLMEVQIQRLGLRVHRVHLGIDAVGSARRTACGHHQRTAAA